MLSGGGEWSPDDAASDDALLWASIVFFSFILLNILTFNFPTEPVEAEASNGSGTDQNDNQNVLNNVSVNLV